jgi:methylated-DNA-[protein]-cysteine S-methyltransferase
MPTLFIDHTGPTPIGDIWLAVSDTGLVAVEFPTTQADFALWLQARHHCDVELAPDQVAEAVRQVREYLSGQRRAFDLPIDWSVLNAFQRKTLELTYAIPYGETRTYQRLAAELGNPRAARAVGRAQATNPMPLVLPCHRVVGTDGKLHGYGGGDGLPTKEWLLRLEGARP